MLTVTDLASFWKRLPDSSTRGSSTSIGIAGTGGGVTGGGGGVTGTGGGATGGSGAGSGEAIVKLRVAIETSPLPVAEIVLTENV